MTLRPFFNHVRKITYGKKFTIIQIRNYLTEYAAVLNQPFCLIWNMLAFCYYLVRRTTVGNCKNVKMMLSELVLG